MVTKYNLFTVDKWIFENSKSILTLWQFVKTSNLSVNFGKSLQQQDYSGLPLGKNNLNTTL